MKINGIPVIAFAAYSGTGKTTLVEKIILNLKAKGYRAAVIKHDAHHFEIDHEGKDSWRFAKAGADMTIISSAEKTAVIEQRSRTLMDNLNTVHDVDIILVEGYKNEDLPKIGISRQATGKGFTQDINSFVAIVTDEVITVHTDVPIFYIDDADGVTEFIIKTVIA